MSTTVSGLQGGKRTLSVEEAEILLSDEGIAVRAALPKHIFLMNLSMVQGSGWSQESVATTCDKKLLSPVISGL